MLGFKRQVIWEVCWLLCPSTLSRNAQEKTSLHPKMTKHNYTRIFFCVRTLKIDPCLFCISLKRSLIKHWPNLPSWCCQSHLTDECPKCITNNLNLFQSFKFEHEFSQSVILHAVWFVYVGKSGYWSRLRRSYVSVTYGVKKWCLNVRNGQFLFSC